ncbi:hypothetical protein OQA88_2749 [Cercophora sp. LCS_1]
MKNVRHVPLRSKPPDSSEGGPATKQSKYATAEDWDKFRDIITSLYLHENKALREVRQYMEEKHNFFATDRMYKIRLKAWSLRKNNTEATIKSLLALKQQRDRAGKNDSVFYLHGRPVDWDDISRYLKRKPDVIVRIEDSGQNLEIGNAGGIVVRTPSPDPVRMLSVPAKMPDDAFGEVFVLYRDYMSGGLDSGVWIFDPCMKMFISREGQFSSIRIMNWVTALWEEVSGAESDAAVLSRVNKRLDGLAALIKEQDVLMFTRLVQAFVVLFGWNPEVGRMLVRFVADLCEAVFGKGHPLAMAVRRLMGLGVDELMVVLNTAGRVRLDLMATSFKGRGDGKELAPAEFYWFTEPVYGDGVELQRLLRTMSEICGEPTFVLSGHQCLWLMHLVVQAIFYGYDEDAEGLLGAIDAWLAIERNDPTSHLAAGCASMVRALLCVETGREGDVGPLLTKALERQAWFTQFCLTLGLPNATFGAIICPWFLGFGHQQPDKVAKWRKLVRCPEDYLLTLQNQARPEELPRELVP